jgi:hypothetical protein
MKNQHDEYTTGKVVRKILFDNETYELREETMIDLLEEGLKRQSPPAFTMVAFSNETTTTTRRHHTQQYRVRFEDHLTIDSSNNLEVIPKDETFISKGRVEIGENEYIKHKKSDDPKN